MRLDQRNYRPSVGSRIIPVAHRRRLAWFLSIIVATALPGFLIGCGGDNTTVPGPRLLGSVLSGVTGPDGAQASLTPGALPADGTGPAATIERDGSPDSSFSVAGDGTVPLDLVADQPVASILVGFAGEAQHFELPVSASSSVSRAAVHNTFILHLLNTAHLNQFIIRVVPRYVDGSDGPQAPITINVLPPFADHPPDKPFGP